MAPYTLFARALLAYSVHEHQEGHAGRIEVWIRPRMFAVQDDGRGMGLDRAGYVEHLMGLLVGGAQVVQLHGVGLSLIATATPRLAVESRRGGRLWTQTFSWGVADAPPQSKPAGPETGTRVTFDVPPGAPDIEPSEVLSYIDHWRASKAGLTFVVH
jgi:DNA gyrase/topoisomerase IV subunit B